MYIRNFISTLTITLAVMTSQSSYAQNFNFEFIATPLKVTSTSLDDEGDVYIYSYSNEDNEATLYKNTDGIVNKLHDCSLPDGESYSSEEISKNGTIAFKTTTASTQSIFTCQDGVVSSIDDVITSSTSNENLTGSIELSGVNSSGQAVYIKSQGDIEDDNDETLYKGDGTDPELIFSDINTTPKPLITQSGSVVFFKRFSSGKAAFYLSENGVNSEIIDISNYGFSAALRPSVNVFNDLVFLARRTGSQLLSIVGIIDGKFVTIAEMGVEFASVAKPIINDLGNVAFLARDRQGVLGVYIYKDQKTIKLISQGNTINQIPALYFSFVSDAIFNNQNQVLVRISLLNYLPTYFKISTNLNVQDEEETQQECQSNCYKDLTLDEILDRMNTILLKTDLDNIKRATTRLRRLSKRISRISTIAENEVASLDAISQKLLSQSRNLYQKTLKKGSKGLKSGRRALNKTLQQLS